jgi:hypothetical protein
MAVCLAWRVLGIQNDPNSSSSFSAVYYIAMWLDRIDKFVRDGLQQYLLRSSISCPWNGATHGSLAGTQGFGHSE